MSDPQPPTPREEWEALAAEFALGGLADAERTQAEMLAQREPDFARLVGAWQQRLLPLAEAVPEVPAPAGLLERIEAALPGTLPAAAASREDRQIERLQRRLGRWRLAAVGLGLAAAALALLVAVPGLIRPAPAERFVAVLGEGEQSPRFLVSVDLAKGTVSILPVGELQEHDGDFELWLVSGQETRPQSLGLLQPVGARRLDLGGLADAALLRGGLLAVSLEPAGGSPTGLPTGPVVYTGPLLPQPD